MLIPLGARLAVGAVLASAVAFGGYRIGAWREAAAGAEAAKTAADNLATCNTSLAAQRESDLSGANHALEDQLRDATALAQKDAQLLGDLASKLQRNSLDFAANTRAFYATLSGSCSFTPDFVGLLIRASNEANATDRDSGADKATESKTRNGDATPAAVSHPAVKPVTTRPEGTGSADGPPVERRR